MHLIKRKINIIQSNANEEIFVCSGNNSVIRKFKILYNDNKKISKSKKEMFKLHNIKRKNFKLAIKIIK